MRGSKRDSYTLCCNAQGIVVVDGSQLIRGERTYAYRPKRNSKKAKMIVDPLLGFVG